MKYFLLFAMGIAPMAWAEPVVELHGVVAAANVRDSFALLSVGGRPATLVAINAPVAGALRLVAVNAHGVTLSDGRVLRPTPAPRLVQADSIAPQARTEVTTRAPDQRGGPVERIHVSQVE